MQRVCFLQIDTKKLFEGPHFGHAWYMVKLGELNFNLLCNVATSHKSCKLLHWIRSGQTVFLQRTYSKSTFEHGQNFYAAKQIEEIFTYILSF